MADLRRQPHGGERDSIGDDPFASGVGDRKLALLMPDRLCLRQRELRKRCVRPWRRLHFAFGADVVGPTKPTDVVDRPILIRQHGSALPAQVMTTALFVELYRHFDLEDACLPYRSYYAGFDVECTL